MIGHSKLIMMCIAALSLSACTVSRGPVHQQDHPQLVASPDKASIMLADAADRASSALETLAAVEQARSPGIAVNPIPDAPSELRRAITLDWVGPAEQVTKTLADRAGYVFNTVGNPPPVPIIVTLNVENKPVIDVLRSLGLQFGQRADLKVDAQARVVEMHYAPNTGVGMPAEEM